MSKLLMDAIWELDDGKTWKYFDENYCRMMRNLPIGTKLEPTLFAYENGVINKNDKRPWNAEIVGRARAVDQLRVLVRGYKTPTIYWAGFWREAK